MVKKCLVYLVRLSPRSKRLSFCPQVTITISSDVSIFYSPIVLDRYGRSTTTPSRTVIETPTKPSNYRSPHRSPLDVLLFSSALGNNGTCNLRSPTNNNKESDDSTTPTAIKASLLSNSNTTNSTSGTNGSRKASKPLPGLPEGKVASEDDEEQQEENAAEGEITPPSLPSFSNLKLSEMRMSGMWFAQP